MKRYRIRLQSIVVNSGQSFLAAVVGARHLHLSALILHHAAGLLFHGHLRVWSHTRHRRSHTGHQQQQNHSELAQRLHLVRIYPVSRTPQLTGTDYGAVSIECTSNAGSGSAKYLLRNQNATLILFGSDDT